MLRRPLFIAALASVVPALAPAGTAHGHAVLIRSEPASGQLLAEAPAEVRMTFNERVSLALGGVDVLAASGAGVGRGPPQAVDNRVLAPVDAHEPGTYAVAWRVLSADGHPVRGAFVFSVGRRSESGAAKRAFEQAETDRGLSVAFGVVRFLNVAGILIAVGGVIFAAVVAPRAPPRFVAPALGLVIVASIAGFFVQAAIAGGVGIDDTLDRDIVDAQLSTLYGNAAIVRVVLAVLGLVALRLTARAAWEDAPTRLAVAGVFVALALSQSITGHAMAASPMAVRLPLDMLHVLFAAVWLGGLVQLHRHVSDRTFEGASVARYSRFAFASVVVLVVTGSFAALVESDVSLRALVETTYGRVLLAKLGLFALTLPIANVNRTRHVPAIVAGGAQARLLLRRFMRFEIAILTLLVALTAWLIETTPARHARHQAAVPPGPINEVRTLPSGSQVRLTIEPAAVGPNTVTVRVRTPAGRPDASVDALTVTGSLRERRISRLPLKVRRRGPGLWTAGAAVLPLPGRWRFDVALRRGEFEEERTHVDGEIAAPGQQP
jgi:copper transport protein